MARPWMIISKLKSDWNLVMSYNPKRIYYAHANEKIL